MLTMPPKSKKSRTRTATPTAQQEAGSWYTVSWDYPSPKAGGAVGGIVEVRARNAAEVRTKLNTKLQKEGVDAKDIKIVKGRDPRLLRWRGPERHTTELQTMLGRLHLHAASGEPAPIWGSPDIMPDPDASARKGWDKFMDESSYGLSVSSLPLFIMCDVEGYPQLDIPPEAVREQRWDGITAYVNELVGWWESDLQGSIDRRSNMESRSAEDTELVASMKARLKELKAFDGWTYQGFVDAHAPGATPVPFDLDNPRLYRLSNGQLIPTTSLHHYRVKVDFWRRLLSLWDGPVNKRADTVRAFLDHHHINGGKPEVFRDLVQDTITRLRTLHDTAKWGTLPEKLSEWHTSASSTNSVQQHGAEFLTPAGALAFVRKLIREAGQLATRTTNVDALLNEHLNGPHAVAFVEFIRGEVLKWKRDAASNRPPPNNTEQFLAAHGLAGGARLSVDPWLVDRCERWLASVGNLTSTTTTKPSKVKATASDPNAWPDLKSLALFYAYRWEHENGAVDFTSVDAANDIARQAGFARRSSGKTLLENYRRYTVGEPGMRRIERTKEGTRPGDILRRFALVLDRLAAHPESLAIAQTEHAIVRSRANGTED